MDFKWPLCAIVHIEELGNPPTFFNPFIDHKRPSLQQSGSTKNLNSVGKHIAFATDFKIHPRVKQGFNKQVKGWSCHPQCGGQDQGFCAFWGNILYSGGDQGWVPLFIIQVHRGTRRIQSLDFWIFAIKTLMLWMKVQFILSHKHCSQAFWLLRNYFTVIAFRADLQNPLSETSKFAQFNNSLKKLRCEFGRQRS